MMMRMSMSRMIPLTMIVVVVLLDAHVSYFDSAVSLPVVHVATKIYSSYIQYTYILKQRK